MPIPDAPAGEPAAEWDALGAALEATSADVLRARASLEGVAGGQDAAIFDAHLLFLEDEALLAPTRTGVFDRGESAARAWRAAVAAAAQAWDALEDPYQRARAADLRSVGDQVLGHLLGESPTLSATGPGVVIAPDLSPAQVVGLDRSATAGVACAFGGPTSHAAILARALGLPAVVGAGAGLLAVADGTLLAVDGDAGTVTVEPAPDAVAAVDRRRRRARARPRRHGRRPGGRRSRVTGRSCASRPTSRGRTRHGRPSSPAPTASACCAPSSCSSRPPPCRTRRSRRPPTPPWRRRCRAAP